MGSGVRQQLLVKMRNNDGGEDGELAQGWGGVSRVLHRNEISGA